MQKRQTKPRKGSTRAKKVAAPPPVRSGSRRSAEPLPFIDDIEGRRFRCTDPTSMFSGPRPESVLGGLEPAFVLFDSSVMQALRTRAAERGMEYDTLVRIIVRENVDDY